MAQCLAGRKAQSRGAFVMPSALPPPPNQSYSELNQFKLSVLCGPSTGFGTKYLFPPVPTKSQALLPPPRPWIVGDRIHPQRALGRLWKCNSAALPPIVERLHWLLQSSQWLILGLDSVF